MAPLRTPLPTLKTLKSMRAPPALGSRTQLRNRGPRQLNTSRRTTDHNNSSIKPRLLTKTVSFIDREESVEDITEYVYPIQTMIFEAVVTLEHD